MSLSASPTFGIYEFLTRMVPGSVLFISIYFTTGNDIGILRSLPPIAVLALVTIFYVLGELIEFFRVSIYSLPRPFRLALYTESNNMAHLGNVDSWKLRTSQERWWFPSPSIEYNTIFAENGDNFWDRMTEVFSFDEDYENTYRIYDVFDSEMDPKISSSTRRVKRTYVFFQNLQISVVLSVAIPTFIFAFSSGDSSIIGIRLFFLVVLVIFFLYLYRMVFKEIKTLYVDSLINEFYREMNRNA